MRLEELNNDFTELEKFGFQYSEEVSTDLSRWAWYYKRYELDKDHNFFLEIRICLLMSISDNPASIQYNLERVESVVFERHSESYYINTKHNVSITELEQLKAIDLYLKEFTTKAIVLYEFYD